MAVSLVTGLGTLNAQALITKYSNQLRRNAILRDIYTNLKGQDIIYEGQRLAIPNGIYTNIKASDTAGANSVRVILKMPVNANIITGGGIALGTEVAPVIRSGKLYSSPYRFVLQAPPRN
jgi:LysM repeat protein